jgi:glycine/D-amino acid oxidase-like deaminating enzyme/nitrite reductase/ring-hydroxylating ferredoxin subunit
MKRSAVLAKPESIWSATSKMPTFPALKANIETDVCIVGAGIAGLTTAYLLIQAGKKVAVVDDGEIAGGMTSVTTAHLANALDARYFEIERLHGAKGAMLTAESHTAAIHRIEAIAKLESIDCDFERVDGYLFLAPGDSEDLLDRELAACHQAGLCDVEKIVYAPLKSFDTGTALRFPNQAQFHPLKYLAALSQAIKRDGGKIFTNTHVDRIDGGKPARIQAGKHEVTAGSVVVATNAPINDLVAIHTKQAPYMTYAIGTRIPAGSIPHALYWDTASPFHYIRLQCERQEHRGNGASKNKEVLIVGGEDHRTGQVDDTDQRHARLEEWARERFPMMGAVEFIWSGQVMDTFDKLAFIGRNPLDKENVFIATGDCGMGITHGTIAGMLLCDLIMGRENPWETLYSPSRKTLRAAAQYAKEALNTAGQYTDWLTGGDVSSSAEIAKESGAIVRDGLKKLAVYRDEHGKLHKFSAACTHLGCVVQWNAAEKTWDCPCHGSRFDKLGEAINGPANTPLSKIEDS